jgi:hypothetical protein
VADRRGPGGVNQRTLSAEPDTSTATPAPPPPPEPPGPPADTAPPPRTYAPVVSSSEALWERRNHWLAARRAVVTDRKE